MTEAGGQQSRVRETNKGAGGDVGSMLFGLHLNSRLQVSYLLLLDMG